VDWLRYSDDHPDFADVSQKLYICARLHVAALLAKYSPAKIFRKVLQLFERSTIEVLRACIRLKIRRGIAVVGMLELLMGLLVFQEL
jgi:hypothetical protein